MANKRAQGKKVDYCVQIFPPVQNKKMRFPDTKNGTNVKKGGKKYVKNVCTRLFDCV